MEKRNQDFSKADVLSGLATLAGHACDDFGLLESLSADMLSPNEARRFAEHLETCEYCRRECALAYEAGVYEDSPFADRMSAFEADPAAETDENWRKIAVAFNEALAPLLSVKPAAAARPIANDIYVAPAFEEALAKFKNAQAAGERSENRPAEDGAASEDLNVNPPKVNRGGKKASKMNWRVLSYSVSAVVVFVAVGITLIPSPAPDVPAVPRAQNGARGLGAPGLTKGDAKTAAETLEFYELDLSEDDGEAYQLSVNIADAWSKKDYQTAASELAKLIEELEKAQTGDDSVLAIAYWNRGVAVLKSEDRAKAGEIFKLLKQKKLNGALDEAEVDAAIKACE